MAFAITTTYLLPAIFLNPAFILHLINTFISHMLPPPPTMSESPHPIFESLGPLPGTSIAFDMHEDNALCWRYTAIMVLVQLWAFGKVSDNRIRRRHLRADRVERERLRRERRDINAGIVSTSAKPNGLDGTHEFESDQKQFDGLQQGEIMSNNEESMTETSEEEIIV